MTPLSEATLATAQYVVALATTRAVLGREAGQWREGTAQEIAALLADPSVAALATDLLEATRGHARTALVAAIAWEQGCGLALDILAAARGHLPDPEQVAALAAEATAEWAALETLAEEATDDCPV